MTRRFPWFAMLALVTALLAACSQADIETFVHSKLNDPTAGSGPITLSAGTQEVFNEYLGQTTPLYFAITADGQSAAYTACRETRCARTTSKTAIFRCEQQSGGTPCKIYASGRYVTWRYSQP